ncbi:MAG: bifunctional 4-hydroxy-2-oxoglutarate aldolase/2-dehydro-3-deoxy-phosphogluconate aldolase [Bacillota bacterium]
MDINEVKSRICQEKIVPVVKLDRLSDTLPLLDALRKGGINVAEITYRTDCAGDAIRIGAETYPDMLVGAGTVISKEQAISAISNGAQFIVSPGFSADVAKVCAEYNMLYLPGGISPTEIMNIMSYGLDIIKVFPASNIGGLGAIKSLAAPFPYLKFMPTGGVSQANLAEYLSCPAIIACGGSWMVASKLVDNGEWDKITELSKKAVEVAR